MKLKTLKRRRMLTFEEWAARLLHEIREVRSILATVQEQLATVVQQQVDMAAALNVIGGDVQQVESNLATVTEQLQALNQQNPAVDLQPVIDANTAMQATLSGIRGKLEGTAAAATPPADATTPPTA